MTELSALTNESLLQNLRALVQDERKLMRQVLEHLEEVERRRLHVAEGYPSLFEYCRQALGYSENEAYSRISSMRLMRQVPEVKAKLETGSLNITNLTLAQTLFRREPEKFATLEKKSALLDEFAGKSKRECERIAAKLAPGAINADREIPRAPDQTELRVTLSDAALAKLQRLKELTGKTDYADLLEHLADFALAKKDPAQGRPARSVGPAQGRSVPISLKRAVWKRDDFRCTYVSSGRRCTSRYRLQVDHINPWAAGGATELSNLRLLCPAHNRQAAIRAYGPRKMAAYFR
jgi:hypothetical protein